MNAIKKARHRSDDPEETVLDESPFQGDLNTELKAAPKRRRPGPTTVLVAGVIAVAGFIGGIQAHKTWGAEESGGAPTAAGGGQNGQRSQSGQGPGGSFGGMTSGTVAEVKDGVIYVKTSDGKTVQVKTSGDTKITLSEEGSAKDLKSGASVVVQGETADDGTVTASTVTEGGGMGGFGGMRPQSGN
ncbi:hypothetical protein ABGB12_16690 [Actinocorallia sp. B10E7]|uniref:hypothetical protein n=1 Tax=Actinocorallia sp. B10E7 TaxID=3153558 RepID=UPI00325F5376